MKQQKQEMEPPAAGGTAERGRKMSYQIVAFGDSNTRYYLGDTGTPGPLEDAWPAKLEGLLWAQGADVQVENQGYPGVQADFAMERFASVTAGADLCILGFGTNDAKKLEVPLGEFLSEISAVLDQAAEAGLPLILLGIPWFSQEVAGPELQARLPVWNESLSSLCDQLGIPFVDLYTPFRDDPERWFNEETTPKRHLSAQAHTRVAELLLPLVLKQMDKG